MRVHITKPNRYNREASPSDWVEERRQALQAEMPGLRLAIMSGDDLPYLDDLFILKEKISRLRTPPSWQNRRHLFALQAERKRVLVQRLSDCFGHPELGERIGSIAARLEPDLAFGLLASDTAFVQYTLNRNAADPLCRAPISTPSAAFILLAPACFDSTACLAYTTGLTLHDCEHKAPAAPQQGQLAHEEGHLRSLWQGLSLRPWEDELRADRNSVRTFLRAGQQEAATHYLLTRAANSFLGQISYTASGNWNLLTQQGLFRCRATSITADKAAHLELKHRAAAWLSIPGTLPPVSSRPREIVQQSFSAPSHDILRHLYDSRMVSPLVRRLQLKALERVIEADTYTHPGTRELAQITLAAAETLFPNVMRRRSLNKYLRPQPQPV